MSRTTSSRKLEIYTIASVLLLFIIVVTISGIKVDKILSDNVSRRANAELQAAAIAQKHVIHENLDEYFSDLEYLANVNTGNSPFSSEESRIIAKERITRNDWKTVGYAEPDGKAVSFEGVPLGNVSERDYFRNITEGNMARTADYISETNIKDGSKFIIAVPIMSGGKVNGVIFSSMEIPAFENNMLNDAEEDDFTEIIVMRKDGTIIAANSSAKVHIKGTNYFRDHERGTYGEEMNKKKLTAAMNNSKSGHYSFIHDNGAENICFQWIGINDWYVIAMADIAKATAKYEANQMAIRDTIKYIFFAFALMIVFIMVSSAFILARRSKAEKALRFEQTKNDLLLEGTAAGRLVYDVQTGEVTLEGSLFSGLDEDKPQKLSNLIQKVVDFYPDRKACMDRIENTIKKIISIGNTEVLDEPMRFNQRIRWIRMTFVPFMSDRKKVSHVFVYVEDTMPVHTEFEKNAEMLKYMPGGFHRCYLGNPIHVEYISDGLCRLLGYTSEEILEKTGGKYSVLIHEDDRPLFRDFAYRLAEHEMTETCEYRLICKDGSVINVSDTMESVIGFDGIMYGYSAVTDISDKIEELNEAKEQIKEGEKREALMLEEHRLLVTAAKKAYAMIISANLTQNSYCMIERDNFTTKKADYKGNYDELIEVGVSTVPDEEQAREFEELFNRKSLIEAFKRGEKSVSMRHKQVGADGVIHWIDTNVIFVEPDENGNIRQITLSCNVDDDQNKVEELKRLLKKQSVYHEAIMSNCAGYMEIDFTTGYVEGDTINFSEKEDLQPVNLPAFNKQIQYDSFEKWWSEYMLVSEKDAFIKTANSAYILSQYNNGRRYIEIPCSAKFTGNGKEYDLIQMYFLFEEETTEHIKGICVLNDITELEENRKEILQLNEALRDSRIKNSISQMHPHFLYNALASIREIILENPEYASDLICDFTTHLRACVKSMSNNDLVPFSQELENIRAYLNIEKMRFGDRLNIQYDISCDDFMIVPLSIQPLVENAVRHGIYNRGMKGGTIKIKSTSNNTSYTVTVQDDGVGFDCEKIKQEIKRGERDSTGLINLIFRLEKLLHAEVIIDSKIDCGTMISVHIPKMREETNK